MDPEEDIDQGRRNGVTREELMSPGILRISSINPKGLSFTPLSSPQAGERHSVTFALVEDLKKIEDDTLKDNSVFEDMLVTSVGRADTVEEEEEDDYSASVSAMIHRRNSRRSSRRRKRGSSPFVNDETELPGSSRRRSSVFTTSSGDTAISIDLGLDDELETNRNRQQISEKLKVHKEVLAAVKYQPWPLKKKLKLVRQAKAYIRRHEGALQVRLAQSRNTRDVLARASLFINKKWQYFRRELVNLQTWLVPWGLRIKEIESHFGSAVASYFTFLRWLFWINFVISLTLTAFVAVPEILTADTKLAGDRKIMPPEEIVKSKHFLTLWEFEGILKYSPFFYGWYTNWEPPNGGYRMPLAYFLANLMVYTYSFVAILRKMAENSRMSKLSEKEDECAFSWKLFTAWDFMIGNPETAHNRVASTILGFKEALLEEAEKEKKLGHWKITTVRIFVNLSVMFLLALSAYAVVEVVARSMRPEAESSWWRQNEITIVMSLISYIFPYFFEVLGLLENYHPRKQLRLQLGRIMVLNLLNLYSLIIALFDKISHMERELKALKPKDSFNSFSMGVNVSQCRTTLIECEEPIVTSTVSSTSPTKAAFITAGIAAMNLIMSPNVTDNLITNTSPFTPTFNNSFEEIPFDFDGFMNYDYSNSFEENTTMSELFESTMTEIPESTIPGISESTISGISDTTISGISESTIFETSENSIPQITELTIPQLPQFDEKVKWEPYSEKDDSPINYDDYDNEDYEKSSTLTSVEDPITEHLKFSTPESPSSEGLVPKKHCLLKICDVCNERQEDHWERKDKKGGKVSLTAIKKLNITTKQKLRKLCWETMFGQELAKLTMMDLVLTIIATLGVDFFRAVFVRYANSWWCWDLEKQFPQYGDFKIAENILHLVNNQGMVWMGMFFSPGLTVLNLIKLGILMYLRSWAVMTCNVPHEVVFKASRSNNFYLALLLTMLFLCVLPVGYAIVWVEPSWHCGPFSGYYRIYYMATQSLKNKLPKEVHKALDYIASPGIVIPLIVLMALIIYYMVSLAGSLREANNDLKIQLRHERTEERRKMFKIAEKRSQGHDTGFAKWKKILPSMGIVKNASLDNPKISKGIEDILQEKRRRATDRIRSVTSEADEATDAEPISLPADPLSQREVEEISEDSDKIEIGTNVPRIHIDSIEIDVESHEPFEIPENDILQEEEVNTSENEEIEEIVDDNEKSKKKQ